MHSLLCSLLPQLTSCFLQVSYTISKFIYQSSQLLAAVLATIRSDSPAFKAKTKRQRQCKKPLCALENITRKTLNLPSEKSD